MRNGLKRLVYRRITSLKRRDAARRSAQRKREARGEGRQFLYFHRFGDPASVLMPGLVRALAERFDADVVCHLVGLPEAAVAPEPDQLDAFSLADSVRLAGRLGLDVPDLANPPSADRIAAAEAAAAERLGAPDALERIAAIDTALWSGGDLPPGGGRAAAARQAGEALRDRLGHFQSATLWYEGEWYWAADRLHHLEARLICEAGDAGLTPQIPVLHESSRTGDCGGARLTFFPSLRSPYTYLAAERVFALARRWNVEVDIHFVLPMVMRSLPVPRRKGVYFLKDCAREAQRLGLPFGDISDPLGRPTERGLAVLHRAIGQGKGEAFLLSFLRGAWSEGIDGGSDRGLRIMAERAGLDRADVDAALADESWRAVAERHRTELAGLGLWGVPSYRAGDCAVWGQDRLWVVEDALQHMAEHST